jgi:hypothetical protein
MTSIRDADSSERSVDIKQQDIYHLLSRAFSQCVPIAQVIDLDIFDIIPILNVYL